jgi:hypothetical protein
VFQLDARELSQESPYIAEYIAAIERTERLGFEAPPRVLAQIDGLDMSVLMPVLLDFYEENSPEDLMGQTLAINLQLVPRLFKRAGVHFNLTIGWMVRHGKPIFPHDEGFIQQFVTDGSDAWIREGCPFHIWLTALSCEVLDVTFAINLCAVHTRAQCAEQVVYQSARAVPGEFIYHPTLVGTDFFYRTGAIL